MNPAILASAQSHKKVLTHQKQQVIKTLRFLGKLEVINRYCCYLCLIPSFYALACVSENRIPPTPTQVGVAGLVTTMAAAGVLRRKDDDLLHKLHRINQNLRQLSC